MKNKLEVNADHFANDRARQVYVEGRLAGGAALDLDPYLREDNPDAIASSEALLKHLWNEYHNPNQLEEAITKFNALEMKPGDDFSVFKNTFVRLAGECRHPKDKWKAEFKRRLIPALQNQLIGSYLDPSVTFEAFARLGNEISMHYKQANLKKTVASNAAANNGRRNPGKTSTTSTSKTPASKSAANTTTSTDELRRLAAEGRCFVCKEKGHLSRDCVKKDGSRADRINLLVSNYEKYTQHKEAATKDEPVAGSARITEISSNTEN